MIDKIILVVLEYWINYYSYCISTPYIASPYIKYDQVHGSGSGSVSQSLDLALIPMSR